MAIFNRFPSRGQAAAVYAITCLFLYSWTLLWFFWKIPGWLYFQTLDEIAVGLAYSLATNLLESLVLILLPLGLHFLLPRRFADSFVARGSALVILSLGYVAFLLTQFQSREDYPSDIIRLTPFVFIAILALAYLLGRISLTRKILENIADRAIVFLYIFIPASLVSLVVVLTRQLM